MVCLLQFPYAILSPFLSLFLGSTNTAEINPLFAILVVCSIVLIIFLILTIIAIWKRSRRKKPPVAKAHTRRDDSENTFQSTEATITKIDQNGLEEVGNPDVIPNKNGMLVPCFPPISYLSLLQALPLT
jgi:hypothetical protein